MKCSVCGNEKVTLNEGGEKKTVCPVCDYLSLTTEEKIVLFYKVKDAEYIDHPAHYNSEKYECIGVMEEIFGAEATQDFCLLNAFKYLWRCKSKHQTPEEDIKKARWYLDKWISLQKNFSENLDKE